MATKFLEPGGDADFLVGTTNGFWQAIASAPAVATDFVHGAHIKSIAYRPSNGDTVKTTTSSCADAGTRMSVYVYFNVLPNAVCNLFVFKKASAAFVQNIRMTSGGVLQLWDGTVAQIGTNGATLSTGQWYRICLAYTITDTTHNRFELFVDGVSSISVTNATISNTATSDVTIGNSSVNTALDWRTSDHYIDDSSSLTDTGNIWVTAKRPFANGTANNFNTQIGAGGSGYGTGHSPQVNERALSTTNGWSIIGAGSAVTEEYNIESAATGDIDISGATIVDYLGWVSASALAAETINVIVNGTNFAQALTTTATMYKKVKGSTTYPAGTGTDIGAQTDTALTTTSLYECGVLVAYTPATPGYAYNVFTNKNLNQLADTGVGGGKGPFGV